MKTEPQGAQTLKTSCSFSEGEEAKEVTLTLKMTGVKKEAEGKTGELNLNLKITPGEKIKSPLIMSKKAFSTL